MGAAGRGHVVEFHDVMKEAKKLEILRFESVAWEMIHLLKYFHDIFYRWRSTISLDSPLLIIPLCVHHL